MRWRHCGGGLVIRAGPKDPPGHLTRSETMAVRQADREEHGAGRRRAPMRRRACPAVVMVRDDILDMADPIHEGLEILLVEGEKLGPPRPVRLLHARAGVSRSFAGHTEFCPEKTSSSRPSNARFGTIGRGARPKTARSSRCGWPCSRDGEREARTPATLRDVGGRRGSA